LRDQNSKNTKWKITKEKVWLVPLYSVYACDAEASIVSESMREITRSVRKRIRNMVQARSALRHGMMN
jgi:hypothetical protein